GARTYLVDQHNHSALVGVFAPPPYFQIRLFAAALAELAEEGCLAEKRLKASSQHRKPPPAVIAQVNNYYRSGLVFSELLLQPVICARREFREMKVQPASFQDSGDSIRLLTTNRVELSDDR